jgi:hypothetical protein
VLVAQLMAGGRKETFSGTPPFDVVIGNATEVSLTYRGEAIDLAPFITLRCGAVVAPLADEEFATDRAGSAGQRAGADRVPQGAASHSRA